jgi:hypothetical protein
MTKAKVLVEDAMTKYSLSECISLPLKKFAAEELEATDDRITLWSGADVLAQNIIDSLEKNGYVSK